MCIGEESESSGLSRRSTQVLAARWETTGYAPSEVFRPLNAAFPGIRPLIAIPNLKVAAWNGLGLSHNNLWVLARNRHGVLVSVIVEGKVDEPFDEPPRHWLSPEVEERPEQWGHIQKQLGISSQPTGDLKYELFERLGAAVIQGVEFNAKAAALVVHSFRPDAPQFADYAAFLRSFGVEAAKGVLQKAPNGGAMPFHFLWALGPSESNDSF